jgi:hypothetical protein
LQATSATPKSFTKGLNFIASEGGAHRVVVGAAAALLFDLYVGRLHNLAPAGALVC